MAVAFNTSAKANATSVGITTAGTEQGLFIFVVGATGVTINTPTVDGSSAGVTSLGAGVDDTRFKARAWFKKGLAAGAHTVACTLSSGTPEIYVQSVTGVDQSAAFDPAAHVAAANSDADPSTVSPTLAAGGIILTGAIAYNDKGTPSLSLSSGTTDQSASTPGFGAVGHKATSGSTWGAGGGSTISQIALAVSPAASGQTVTLTPATETDAAQTLSVQFQTRINLFNGSPTSGGTNGTKVTGLNPVKSGNLIAGTGADVESAPIKLAVRADAGKSRAGTFPIQLRGSNAYQWALAPDNAGAPGTWLGWGETLQIAGPVGDTNKVFWAKARATSDEDAKPGRSLADTTVTFRIPGDAT